MKRLPVRAVFALRGWLAILPLMACLACSDGNGGGSSGGDVSGAWCGLQVTTAAACVGDEVIYAEFAQAGTTVTGQSCEHYLTGCYAIENGSLTGGTLTYDYTFSPDRVDASLSLSSDGQTLAGTYASTKCSCDIPVTLHRLP
jgi:hypothetical protein